MWLQDTVSVHRPGFYAHRFLDFMADRVFKKIPSRKYPLISYTYQLPLYYLFNFFMVISHIIPLQHHQLLLPEFDGY